MFPWSKGCVPKNYWDTLLIIQAFVRSLWSTISRSYQAYGILDTKYSRLINVDINFIVPFKSVNVKLLPSDPLFLRRKVAWSNRTELHLILLVIHWLETSMHPSIFFWIIRSYHLWNSKDWLQKPLRLHSLVPLLYFELIFLGQFFWRWIIAIYGKRILPTDTEFSVSFRNNLTIHLDDWFRLGTPHWSQHDRLSSQSFEFETSFWSPEWTSFSPKECQDFRVIFLQHQISSRKFTKKESCLARDICESFAIWRLGSRSIDGRKIR